jgi:hypothetical protein
MRKLLYAGIALAFVVFNSCGPTHVIVESTPAPPPPPPPAAETSYQSFYDALSPYGQWIDNPQYGYVWMPDAGPDFKPYASNGHWVLTDEGWTWASDYPWGWAAFHYGRWFFEEGYGWMWIPGNEWAPAWVSWRRSDDYYGWAPLGPSVSVASSYGGNYNPPPHYWNFVPHQYVTSPHLNNYYVSDQRNVTIINNTTIIRNTNTVTYNRVTANNYAGGPDPQEVSRVTGAPLRPVTVRETNSPGERMGEGALTIYRPRVNAAPQNNGGSQPHVVPARVQNLNNVRPVNTARYNQPNPNNGNGTISNNPNSNNPNNSGNSNYNRPGQQTLVQPSPAPIQPAPQQANHLQPTSAQQPSQQANQRPAYTQPPTQQSNQRPAYTQPATPQTGLTTPQTGLRPTAGQPATQPATQQSNQRPAYTQPTTPQTGLTTPQTGLRPTTGQPAAQPTLIKPQPSQQQIQHFNNPAVPGTPPKPGQVNNPQRLNPNTVKPATNTVPRPANRRGADTTRNIRPQ